MNQSPLTDIERRIRYERLNTAAGIQYLCTDGINDSDYRFTLRLFTRDAAEAWVAERRKIGSGTVRGLAPNASMSYHRRANA